MSEYNIGSETGNGIEDITSMFASESEQPVRRKKPHAAVVKQRMNPIEMARYAKYNSIVMGVAAATAIAGVVGVAGTYYFREYAAAMAPHIDGETTIEPGAKATVETVDMDIQPITLSTAETNVTGVNAKFQNKVSAMGGLVNFSMNKSGIVREADAELQMTLDPNDVTISYDPNNEKMKVKVENGSLTTKVDIPTAQSKTVDTSGSFTAMPSQVAAAMTEAIAGTFGKNANEVPILGDIAKGRTDIKTGLEQYADLYIVTQVDEQCTPLIPEKLPNYTVELKRNVLEAIKGQLLNPDVTSNSANASLSSLMDKPLSEVQKIADNAEVEMSDDFTFSPDQKNIDELKKYEKSEFFSAATSGSADLECGISKSAKLTRTDDEGASK